MDADRSSYANENEARSALIATCLRMSELGINQGKSGNVSLRWHRGGEMGLLITPSGIAYERLGVDDIAWLPLQDVEGDAHDPDSSDRAPVSVAETMPATLTQPTRFDGPHAPSSEWRIHHDLMVQRPETGAVLHAHPVFASTLACSARVQRDGIPAFHYMIAVAGGATIRCAPYARFGSARLSTLALAALVDRRACLLANHGLMALGGNLESALALALEVETLSRMYWQLLQLGDAVILNAEEMQRVGELFKQYGQPRSGET
ncbi:MAG: hypothetical protein RLZZ153_28 [Pseudomonadota bacterium]|jgi:L-fuculose-phosphate aldolase